jgi:DNA-binding response OmpR family regulator
MFAKCIPMTSISKTDRKILLIEDNDLYRESLSELLEILGYQVLALPDGFAFLQCLDQFQPDIIILDLHLPSWDGFTLMKKWQKSIHNNVPIFILSASERLEEREKAIALGARHFLPKSTTVRDLDRVIAAELNC